jgi:uncharacterized membrane protein
MQATSTSQHQAESRSQQRGAEQSGGCCSMTQVNVGDSERAMSALAGGALIALAPSGVTGWVVKLAGCGLLYRAITGHCFVYQNLDMNTAS